MEIIVQKFGGTSVGNIERIQNVANIIKSELNSNQKLVVVVSAMSGVTNMLISQCNELSHLNKQEHMREYDAALATGESVTSSLLALQLQKIGINAQSLQSWQIPLKTDANHSNAQITDVGSQKLLDMLNNGITPIITGFQGLSVNGDITTIGKGGSDTSAAIITAAIKAKRCDIYTDVDGIFTADPRIVHNAKKIDVINIDELCALCSAGAKVLHPRAALAAKRYNFEMRILSSFSKNQGTTIKTDKTLMENRLITAITSNKNLLKINFKHPKNSFSKIFSIFTKNLISVEQSCNLSETDSYIIANLSDQNKCELLLKEIKSESLIEDYSIQTNIASVTIVGYGIKNDSNLIASIIDILTNNNIQILASYSSDVKISFIINDQNNEKAIKLIHQLV